MNLGLILGKYLSPQANSMLKAVGRIGNDLDEPVYLVGGAVRDVLLGRPSNDLDFVTEGSGIKLAKMVCEKLGGELTTHDRFGTAVWTPPSGQFNFTIDFITARKETYAHPAALPDIVPSNMKDDLFRRDFTVNAMAVRIDGNHFGELLDIYGGQADLDQKQVAILHSESFSDDPTRIFRAIRYACRVGFELTAETLSALQKNAAKINLLSADRIRHEIEKILGEQNPHLILKQLDELGVLGQISTDTAWQEAHKATFKKLDAILKTDLGKSALAESGLIHLRFLSWICASSKPKQTAVAFGRTLNFSADMQRDLDGIIHFSTQPNQLSPEAKPGTVEKAFRKLTATQLTILQIIDYLPAEVTATIPTYFAKWRNVKTFTNGNTLRNMGLPPGPNYKIILDTLLNAKLNGEITTEQEEQAFLQSLL